MKKIILTALLTPLSLKALEVTDHNTFLEPTLKAEAQAEDANQAKAYLLSAGVGFMHFDYKEKLDGPLKSNESGSLPFMKIEGEYRLGQLATSPSLYAEYEYASGQLNYDGAYQNSQGQYAGDASSKTPTHISDFHLAYVHNFTSHPGIRGAVDGYVGFGQHRWFRGSEKKAGQYEVSYVWNYIPVGVRFYLYEDQEWTVQPKAEIKIQFDGKADVSMSQVDDGYSDMELPLGAGSALRIELPMTRNLGRSVRVRLSPFYEQIDMGRGKYVQVVYEGQPVQSGGKPIVAHEPASRTQMYGSDLSITVLF